ncbi:MAG: hypothetical protein N3I35_04770 [Clostridia bacterium]|nr:hypothetical protein [Clostridia bacterium]
MKSMKGIIMEGEKLALERVTRNDKTRVTLHMLNGFESVQVTVRDVNLEKVIDNVPNRKPIKIKAEVQTYKDELYFQALELVV